MARSNLLVSLRLALETDPTNAGLQMRLQELISSINNEEEAAARVQQQRLHAAWVTKGDRCSKLFFRTIKARSLAN